MANTTIKLKRSSVAGKQPNTSTLSTGELAINITDQKLYSSDGATIFEPAGNVTSIYVGNSSLYTTINSTSIVGNNGLYLEQKNAGSFLSLKNNGYEWKIYPSGPMEAGGALIGGSYGANRIDLSGAAILEGGNFGSQIKASNDRTTYYTWTFGGDGLLTLPGSGTINSTSYTGTANNATNFGGQTYTTVTGYITGNAATAYSNATSYADTKAGTAYTNAIAIAANATNLTSGTVNEARLPYRMNQNVTTTNNVTFANIALTGGTVSTLPVNSTDIVNKQYADAIATGINFHQAVRLASPVGGTFTGVTYYNGPSSNGVGATLTKTSGGNSALILDGVTVAYQDRVLIKAESPGNTVWNGIYSVTNTGSGSYAWVLTRAYDYDQVGSGTNEIDQGDLIYVTSGATGAGTSWVEHDVVTNIGVDPITFVQFSSKALYALTDGTGLYYSVGGAYDGSAASTLAVNTAYIGTLTANNTSFVGSVSAANVVSNNQLSSNLANYQTTAGLSSNVATLTANNASYLGTVAAASYVQNTDSRTLSGNLNFTGANSYFAGKVTHNANIVINTGASIIDSTGSQGLATQVLTSNGTGNVYWSTPSGGSSTIRGQFTGDGVTTSFVVAGGYVANALSVYLNGVMLRNGTEVDVTSGSSFVVTPAPPSGALIDAIGISTLYSNGVNTIVSQQFTANGTANAFTVSGGYVPGLVQVYVNGVKQLPTTDVIATSGTTVNLITTPANGYVIDVFGYATAIGYGSNTLTVGANVSINSTAYFVGNSTSNTVITGSSISGGNWWISNSTGAYHTGTINAASHTVGTAFTANSTMTNTASLVVSTNTATIGTAVYHVANGNMGIGITNPPQTFALGTSTDQFGAAVSGAVTTVYFGSPSNASGGIKKIAYDRGTGNLNFIGGTVASSSTQMTLDSSGNVGIGTSSPTSKFQVNGGVTINGSSFPSSGVGLELAWDGNESVIQSYNRNTTSYQPIWIESGSYTRFGMNGGEAMRIDSSGNVGIGITSTSSSLHIYRNSTSQTALNVEAGPSASYAPGIYLTDNRSAGSNQRQYQIAVGGYAQAFYVTDTTVGAVRLLIDSSGNVGIGTTSPSGKLDVRGTTYLGNGTIRLAMYSDQSDTGISIEAANYANDTKKNIWLAAYGGNLMVGTTSQIRSSKLSVFGGDVYAPGFKVGSTTANIYVYEGSTNVLAFQVGNTGSLRYFNFDTSGNGNALNGSWVNGSDARLKENVKTLNKGLSEVLSLHPVSYNRIGAEQTEIGFIAQEVQSIIPEVVHDTGEYLGISYGNITAVLVSAIQELSAKNDALEAINAAFEARLATLENNK